MKWTRKLFLRIFRKQIADILHNHSESIQLRHVIEVNASAMSVYIEVLEFIGNDITEYFKPETDISARQTMRRMLDFTGHKLKTLKQLEKEYEKLDE